MTDAEGLDAQPRAASLSESMRAFGYELPTAIADLIDNSIAATAPRVWVDFHWAGAVSAVVVTDDGSGMSAATLLESMRLGSQSPLLNRKAGDLGRFGLGMKTASFSQCRRLTVRSHSPSFEETTLCWDLDHIAKVDAWKVLEHAASSTEPHFARLAMLPKGTAVVWEKLDRIIDSSDSVDSDESQNEFLRQAEEVRSHLALAFHRFIEERRLEIFVNGIPVKSWDPFMATELATQVLPPKLLRLGNDSITVEPFVLPHHSKLSKARYALAAGPRGWIAHQGFYVYRDGRLLLSGGWLGLGWPKDEHHKLARIRVDFPTASDRHWAIDVTKSKASAPRQLRADLRDIAEKTRSVARRVFTYRGANVTPNLQSAERSLALWSVVSKHDRLSYVLNREHPLIRACIDGSVHRQSAVALLRLIEESVPVAHIAIACSERPEQLKGPFEGATPAEIENVIKETVNALVAAGVSRSEGLARIAETWPFSLFPELLAQFNHGSPDA